MIKKLSVVLLTILIGINLGGCGTAQTNNATQPKKDTSMKNMPMGNEQPLTKAFQDELNGFTTIEQDVKKGDYQSAQTLANNLHDEFHAAILPPLTAKKSATYAEAIHAKYDELQDAITNKNTAKIAQLIKVNRDNLNTIAPILSVSLK